jgi:hypothetical protein
MSEQFLHLSPADQLDALRVASQASQRDMALLEKDIWVVWALQTLYGSSFGPSLVFKGGTSLSKAYGVIRRFSEDVDITYDIRALAPKLVKGHADAIPTTGSQEKKWSKDIKVLLAQWVQNEALPIIKTALKNEHLLGEAHAEESNIFIGYPRLTTGNDYIKSKIMLEFGARSTGEPSQVLNIACDAAAYLADLEFPVASPKVMLVERTFWEKATAMHVFCIRQKFRGTDRFARHWYDVSQIGQTEYFEKAVADIDLAKQVARHKAIFFNEKDQNGKTIDYLAAVSGGLRLVPDGQALTDLADDYKKMVDAGFLLEQADSFDVLIEKCCQIESMANMAQALQLGQDQTGRHPHN